MNKVETVRKMATPLVDMRTGARHEDGRLGELTPGVHGETMCLHQETMCDDRCREHQRPGRRQEARTTERAGERTLCHIRPDIATALHICHVLLRELGIKFGREGSVVSTQV
jgi:hypothetical protein